MLRAAAAVAAPSRRMCRCVLSNGLKTRTWNAGSEPSAANASTACSSSAPPARTHRPRLRQARQRTAAHRALGLMPPDKNPPTRAAATSRRDHFASTAATYSASHPRVRHRRRSVTIEFLHPRVAFPLRVFRDRLFLLFAAGACPISSCAEHRAALQFSGRDAQYIAGAARKETGSVGCAPLHRSLGHGALV
jgi:hypothetical protein